MRTHKKIVGIIFVDICICIIVGGVIIFYPQQSKSQNHEVVLKKEGFSPSILTIQQGDTVVFSTENTEPFWPASNIHPEHTLYPAFDPKKPIEADDVWSFTFPDVGRYSFHDHIFANFTGIIIVQAPGDTTEYVASLDLHECAQFEEYSRKRQCWNEQLEQAMKEGGVEGAFAYFNELYKTEPDVPKECHGWSHTLGKAGYVYYKEHGDIKLDPAASSCGYGFYHAFLGELMKDTGDVMKAREFCERASASIPSVTTSCKHGIGHGASSMLSENPEYFGNFKATADGAIAICQRIYTEHADLIECYDGIYNEIYQNILNSRYGYNYNEYLAKHDPYWQCQTQDDEYKESCYVNVVGLFGDIFKGDLLGSIKYAVENTHDLETRGYKIIAKIAADRIQETIVEPSHRDSIEACNEVPAFLYQTCFEGILNGFTQHGEPGNLHPKGYAFCDEFSKVVPSKSSECYENFTNRLKSSYTKEQMIDACMYITADRKVLACTEYMQ